MPFLMNLMLILRLKTWTEVLSGHPFRSDQRVRFSTLPTPHLVQRPAYRDLPKSEAYIRFHVLFEHISASALFHQQEFLLCLSTKSTCSNYH